MKNSLTPARIEPATFRFVAQYLNHCATAVPNPSYKPLKLGPLRDPEQSVRNYYYSLRNSVEEHGSDLLRVGSLKPLVLRLKLLLPLLFLFLS